MKTITFLAYMEFGKCDSTDWEFEYEVTDEEYLRLLEAAKAGFDFADAVNVADIYDRVYEAVVEESTNDFIENSPEEIEDYLEEDESLEEWRADDVYSIGINFPYEWIEESKK